MSNQEMNRRSLMKYAALGTVASGSVAASISSVIAQESVSPFEGSIYYTPENPGRWKGKEKSHTPVIKVKKTEAGLNVTVETAHEMKGFEHYIVKHLLIDKNFKVFGEKMFNPTKELQAKSTFEISGEKYSGVLYAVSVCNEHDAWISKVDVA